MIDLHTHILHGIDDGAETLAESLALARAAVADGITTCAMTPHIHPGRYENFKSSLEQHAETFRTELARNNIPLNITLGAEVRLSIESLEQILSDEVPYLGHYGGKHIMLLELPHQTIPVGSMQFVEKLLSLSIRPLIAHPERNKAIMMDPTRVQPFLDVGCWLQVTAGSVVGDFGTTAQKVALRLLDDDDVYLVASDAHNLDARPPAMSKARTALAKRYGERAAQQLVTDRAANILGLPAEQRQ